MPSLPENESAASHSRMPILDYQGQIVNTVQNAPVTIVVGTTGCGKTTRIPAMLYYAGFRKIACTLPTRPAAIMAAEFVAQAMDEPAGRTVGYHVRFERQSSEKTDILYMTDGMLMQRVHGDPHLRAFNVIMVDEVHERKEYTDVLLAYLKSLLAIRSDLRVVVSSATMQSRRFSEYFGDAPIINIMTRQYPVHVEYRPTTGSLFKAIAQTLGRIHKTGEHGHVLIFLPGLQEISQAHAAIQRLNLKDTICLPLHSRIDRRTMGLVFGGMRQRKVILATNIAETAITIPDVRYVIDSGIARQDRHVPEKGIATLWVRNISQSSATQRAGRAGRTAPGTCIRLYSKESFEARAEFSPPAIESGNITSLVLQLKARGVEHPEKLDLLTPLSEERVAHAQTQLRRWRAMNPNGELTELGHQMARLPLDPQLARMVLLASKHGMAFEAAEVAGFVSIRNINRREGGIDVRVDGRHNQFRDERGDAITFLRLMREYREHRGDLTWCETHDVDILLLERVSNIRDQVLEQLARLGILHTHGQDLDTIHRVLIEVWGGMLCVYHRNKFYRSGEHCDIRIDTHSSLSGVEPQAFVAYDFLHIGSLVARYPIFVPHDMMDEALAIYGNPIAPDSATNDSATLTARGTLRIETAHATRVVQVHVDCKRSNTRGLQFVRNRSMILEEASFPVDWLRLSKTAASALAAHAIKTLADLPKTKSGLARLGLLNGDARDEILRALQSLEYIPASTEISGRAVHEKALAPPEYLPEEEGWLVQRFAQRPIDALELSRGARMHLVGAGVRTIEQLLEWTREKLKAACGRNDHLFEEILERLDHFGFRLLTRQEEKESRWHDDSPATSREPTVSAEQAMLVLGEIDYALFERYHAAFIPQERNAVRNELIMRHQGLLKWSASGCMRDSERNRDRALEYWDLRQEGVFGAMSAIHLFQYRSGFRYSTYASHWIRQVITRLIMNQGVIRIPVHIGEKVERYRAKFNLLAQKLEREPTVGELAVELGVSPEYVLYLASLDCMKRPLSLNYEFDSGSNGSDDDDYREFGEWLGLADDTPNPEEEVGRVEYEHALKAVMAEVLDSLPVPERALKIFKLRWGIDGDDPKTLEEVGKIMGLTRERIRQIEAKVMEAFRTRTVWRQFQKVVPWLQKAPPDDGTLTPDEEITLMQGQKRLALRAASTSNELSDAEKIADQLLIASEVQDMADISAFLDSLPVPEQGVEVFKLHHGVGGDKPLTMTEVGQRPGISRQRAYHLETRVLETMRGQIEDWRSADNILAQACLYFGTAPEELVGTSRKAALVRERHILMFLLREVAGLSYPKIGAFVGGRDHTSVMHACQKIERLLRDEDPDVMVDLRRLRHRLGAQEIPQQSSYQKEKPHAN